MAKDDDQFELKLGPMRSGTGRLHRARSLQSQLISRIARGGRDWHIHSSGPARQSGRFNARGRGARLSAAAAKPSGWSVDRISGMRVRTRRVMVKARVVKFAGVKAASAAQAHRVRAELARPAAPRR